MSRIPSLALQITAHLRNNGALTADQLASITGVDVFQVIDALTWMLGTDKISQDTTPRYRLLKVGASVPSPAARFPLPSGCTSQAPTFSGRANASETRVRS